MFYLHIDFLFCVYVKRVARSAMNVIQHYAFGMLKVGSWIITTISCIEAFQILHALMLYASAIFFYRKFFYCCVFSYKLRVQVVFNDQSWLITGIFGQFIFIGCTIASIFMHFIVVLLVFGISSILSEWFQFPILLRKVTIRSDVQSVRNY